MFAVVVEAVAYATAPEKMKEARTESLLLLRWPGVKGRQVLRRVV
jgi:hypothetical protein